MNLIHAGLGALAAAPFLYFVNRLRPLAIALTVVALVYVAFALVFNANEAWLLRELGGVVLFGLLALASLRLGFACLAVGWGLHVLWDVLLHQSFFQPTFVPTAYPALCLGFDVVIAAFCLRCIITGGEAKL